MRRTLGKIKILAALVLTASMLFLLSSEQSEVFAASSKSGVTSSVSDIHSTFPESYWASLDALQAAHPNWHFQAFYTGLNWEECFGVNSAEMYPTRNLLTVNSGYESSWYSTEEYVKYNGTYYLLSSCSYSNGKWYLPNGTELTDYTIWSPYNWAANTWNTYDSGIWAQASKEAVAYCMDPRNWLTDVQIFQFEDIAWNDSITVEAVQSVFNQVTSDYWKGTISDDNGGQITYGQAVYNIGKELGVNPVALASRIVCEQGVGTSPLISGTYTFTISYGADQGKTATGYYNYFNMNACGDGITTIYNNGLSEAYYNGSTSSSATHDDSNCWNTRYKSLYGGAKKYASNYIGRGQTTPYLQKFNVDSSSTRLFWGQYMQAILSPQIEAKKLYNSYASSGLLDSEKYFLIPVFDNMPASACAKPSTDGNPNYKIGSIMIDGTALSGYDPNVLDYSLTVSHEKATVRFDVSPYAQTSTITVQNTTNGQTMESSGTLTNMTLQLERGYNTIKIADSAENGTVCIYTLTIFRPSEVTYGDVDGDDTYSLVDIVYMRRHILGIQTLTGDSFEAADINGDGSVDLVDLVYVRGYLLGTRSEIPQR